MVLRGQVPPGSASGAMVRCQGPEDRNEGKARCRQPMGGPPGLALESSDTRNEERKGGKGGLT